MLMFPARGRSEKTGHPIAMPSPIIFERHLPKGFSGFGVKRGNKLEVPRRTVPAQVSG